MRRKRNLKRLAAIILSLTLLAERNSRATGPIARANP